MKEQRMFGIKCPEDGHLCHAVGRTEDEAWVAFVGPNPKAPWRRQDAEATGYRCVRVLVREAPPRRKK